MDPAESVNKKARVEDSSIHNGSITTNSDIGDNVSKNKNTNNKCLCLRCYSIKNEYQFFNWLLFDFRELLGISSWFEEKPIVKINKTEKGRDNSSSNIKNDKENNSQNDIDEVVNGEAVVDIISDKKFTEEDKDIEGENKTNNDNKITDNTINTTNTTNTTTTATCKYQHSLQGLIKNDIKDSVIDCVYVEYSRRPYFIVEIKGNDGNKCNEDDKEVIFNKILTKLNGLEFKGSKIEVMPALANCTVATQREKVETYNKKKIQKISEDKEYKKRSGNNHMRLNDNKGDDNKNNDNNNSQNSNKKVPPRLVPRTRNNNLIWLNKNIN